MGARYSAARTGRLWSLQHRAIVDLNAHGVRPDLLMGQTERTRSVGGKDEEARKFLEEVLTQGVSQVEQLRSAADELERQLAAISDALLGSAPQRPGPQRHQPRTR